MKHRLAGWIYRLVTWLAEHGTVMVDTGADYTVIWGPFEHNQSCRHDYTRSDFSLGPIGITVSDEAGMWLVWIGTNWHYVTIECFEKGRKQHAYFG